MAKCAYCGFLTEGESCSNCYRPFKCEACKDVGFLYAYNTDTTVNEIQRCDSCAMIVDDIAATRIHAATCGCDWANRIHTLVDTQQIRDTKGEVVKDSRRLRGEE